MTTKVVKGSFWTLLGQILPLGASLVATPFVIRFLGTEGYGLLILVGLIPSYFGFADFGMGIASTKFGSEAYATGDGDKESRVIRTAALIAAFTALPIGVVLFLFSNFIVGLFNVPEQLLTDANLALKIASITFVVNFLNNIFNTPQLARLRMDLNTLVSTGFRLLGVVVTPVVLYLGGGIVGAITVVMIASLLTLVGHIIVSRRLLPSLLGKTIDRTMTGPLLKFGRAYAISAIAAILLGSTEKLVLARATSVKELAYYSIAFTIASMMTLFSGSMTQSLIPAFSQLQTDELRGQLGELYSRCIRIASVGFIPALVFVAIIAKPFLTFWAGPEFGIEATIPLYILLIGLVFNAIAYFPSAIVIASGRTDILAKVYWAELALYIPLVFLLVSRFGARGAAVAWSVKVIVDAVILFTIVRRTVGISIGKVNLGYGAFAFGLIIMPFVLTQYFSEINPVVIALAILAFGFYGLIVWKKFLKDEEIIWLRNRIYGFLKK